MALRKLTKHSVTGSLLVQYKYANISDDSTSGAGTSDKAIGESVTITPQYTDSIIETTFSCDIENDSNGENQHFRLALYVNGHKEYEHTELLGGPRGGTEATHHGGSADRIYAHAFYAHVKNMRQSAGLIHAYSHGSLNALENQIYAADYNNGSKTFHVRNGFLIVKEIAVGIPESGPQ